MDPPHHRLRVPVRARRHPRGATCLHDLIKGQKALAGARMRRAGRQPPQILRRLTPARAVDMQHVGLELETVIHPLQMGKPGAKYYIFQTGRGLANRQNGSPQLLTSAKRYDGILQRRHAGEP